MWDDLRERVAVEREQLNRLIDGYRSLLENCAASPPSEIEISALAAMLHSFYNGVENIFKCIGDELDIQLSRSHSWHRDLLDSMGRPGKMRPAVISQNLAERLDTYLDFRHFFRHTYVFHLRWDRMKPLVLGCEETLRQLEAELETFLDSGKSSRQHPQS